MATWKMNTNATTKTTRTHKAYIERVVFLAKKANKLVYCQKRNMEKYFVCIEGKKQFTMNHWTYLYWSYKTYLLAIINIKFDKKSWRVLWGFIIGEKWANAEASKCLYQVALWMMKYNFKPLLQEQCSQQMLYLGHKESMWNYLKSSHYLITSCQKHVGIIKEASNGNMKKQEHTNIFFKKQNILS